MYSLVLALVLISMDRYLAALESGGWRRWLLYVAFTGAAVYVHLLAALMVPAQIIAFFLVGGETRKARWKAWLASMGVLLLPYVPLLRWQLPLALSPADTGYEFVPLHEMVVSLLTNYSLGPIRAPCGGLHSFLWFCFLRRGGCGATTGPASVRWEFLPAGCVSRCWVFSSDAGATHVHGPLSVFVLPAYLVLVAAGVVAIARRSRLLAGLLLAALLVLNLLGLWRQSQTPLKADFRSATEYVASRQSPGDLLIFQIPYGRHSFDYYLPRYQEPQPTRKTPQSPIIGTRTMGSLCHWWQGLARAHTAGRKGCTQMVAWARMQPMRPWRDSRRGPRLCG